MPHPEAALQGAKCHASDSRMAVICVGTSSVALFSHLRAPSAPHNKQVRRNIQACRVVARASWLSASNGCNWMQKKQFVLQTPYQWPPCQPVPIPAGKGVESLSKARFAPLLRTLGTSTLVTWHLAMLDSYHIYYRICKKELH